MLAFVALCVFSKICPCSLKIVVFHNQFIPRCPMQNPFFEHMTFQIRMSALIYITMFQGFCSGWALRGDDLSDVKERFPHLLCHLHDFCHWIFTR